MSLKIKRIIDDLGDQEVDIQILALTTIPRMSSSTEVSGEELDKLMELIDNAITSDNGDVVFLARKARNYLNSTFASSSSVALATPSAVETGAPPAVETGAPSAVETGAPPAAETGAPVDSPEPWPVAQPQFAGAEIEEEEETMATVIRPMAVEGLDITRELIKEEDPRRIATLLAELAKVAGDSSVLPRVVSFLEHEDDRVRANAVEVFEKVGQKEHLEFIMPLVNDPNNRVRSNVILVLNKLGHPQAKFHLKQMLSSSEVSMRESAVYALASLKSIELLDLLMDACADPYEGIRLRAVRALGEFDLPEAVDTLKTRVCDDDEVVRNEVIGILRGKGVNIKKLLLQQQARDAASKQAALDRTLGDEFSAAGGREQEKPVSADDNLFHAVIQQITKELRQREKKAHYTRILFKVGIKGYELCRRGVAKEVPMVVLYYEIVKYQEYLHGLSEKVKKGDTSGDNLSILESGISQYKNRIRDCFIKLGKLSAELHCAGKIELPESKELASIIKLMSS